MALEKNEVESRGKVSLNFSDPYYELDGDEDGVSPKFRAIFTLFDSGFSSLFN